MKHYFSAIFKSLLLFFYFVFFTPATYADMTISGTRIIFPSNEREQTVRTRNKGERPILVQVWVDDGSKINDINKIKVPFTVTPPVYRIEPGKGQSVRLIYNGMALPQDRESVYWFNMLEIPPESDANKNVDRLELAFRTRIKIFYRPESLKDSGLEQIDKLTWEVIPPAKGIKITNPTPYYISFDSAYINSGSVKSALATEMISPFSSKEMLLEKKSATPTTVNSVTARLISDYGSIVTYQLAPEAGGKLVIKSVSK